MDEHELCARLKRTYLGLALLEHTMARQRAKIAWLREGDANTTFFHQHASYRRQKNVIHSLQVSGAVVAEHAAMAEATFDHFQAVLGTATDREFLRRPSRMRRFGMSLGTSHMRRRPARMCLQQNSSRSVGGRSRETLCRPLPSCTP
jgi:hypothetical protein